MGKPQSLRSSKSERSLDRVKARVLESSISTHVRCQDTNSLASMIVSCCAVLCCGVAGSRRVFCTKGQCSARSLSQRSSGRQ